MSAKKNTTEEETTYSDANEAGPAGGINDSFDLDEDAIPEPLIPQGNYSGSVVGVTVDGEKHSINWKVTLNGNDGVMSDGETPLDGATVYFRNWLPKPGDENEMTASGRNNKRQSKINQLAKFATQMGVNMRTPAAIMEACDSGEWVGMDVIVTIGISEYPVGSGSFKNDVSRMSKQG